MGISRDLKKKIDLLSPNERDRLVRMAWEDRTSFEAISIQYGLSPNDIVRVMRASVSANGFKLWRKRIFEQGKLKNEKKRPFKEGRFKCKRQRLDGSTKGHK